MASTFWRSGWRASESRMVVPIRSRSIRIREMRSSNSSSSQTKENAHGEGYRPRNPLIIDTACAASMTSRTIEEKGWHDNNHKMWKSINRNISIYSSIFRRARKQIISRNFCNQTLDCGEMGPSQTINFQELFRSISIVSEAQGKYVCHCCRWKHPRYCTTNKYISRFIYEAYFVPYALYPQYKTNSGNFIIKQRGLHLLKLRRTSISKMRRLKAEMKVQAFIFISSLFLDVLRGKWKFP